MQTQRLSAEKAKAASRVRGELRRRQIISSALACFERKGFHETSISDIAELAGISAGLIYKYFADKRAVLFAAIIEIIEAYNRDIPGALIGAVHPLDRFEKTCKAYFEVINGRVAATLFAYRETQSLHPEQIEALKAKELQTNRYIVDCISDCVKEGYFDCRDVEVMSYLVVASAHAWGLKNWRLRRLVTFEQYTKQALSLIIAGLLTPAGEAEYKRIGLDSSFHRLVR